MILIIGSLLFLTTLCIAAAVSLQSHFTLRDLKKLKFPVLDILDDQYDLEDKLELSSQGMESRSDDLASIRSVKKWINRKDQGKEATWENLLWLLKEYEEDALAEELKEYLTSAPVSSGKESAAEESG